MILYGTRVPVSVWQVRLRTAISVYFTLPARIAAAAQIDQSHLSGGAADVNKTLSNTWFFGPICVCSVNGISIGSSVFAGLTRVQTDTQTTHHRVM